MTVPTMLQDLPYSLTVSLNDYMSVSLRLNYLGFGIHNVTKSLSKNL